MRGLVRWGMLVALLWPGIACAESFEIKLLDAAAGPKVLIQVKDAVLRVESVFPFFDKEVLEGSLAGARLVITSEGPPGEILVHVVGATGVAQQLTTTGPAPSGAEWAGYDPWTSYKGTWTQSFAPRPAKLSFRVVGEQAAQMVAERLGQHLATLRAHSANVAESPSPDPLPKAAPPSGATEPVKAKPVAAALSATAESDTPVPVAFEDGSATLRDPEARNLRLIEVRDVDNAQHCVTPLAKTVPRTNAAGESYYEHHVWVSNRCAEPVLALVCYEDNSDCTLDTVPARQLGKFPLSVQAPQKGFAYKVSVCLGSYARGCDMEEINVPRQPS